VSTAQYNAAQWLAMLQASEVSVVQNLNQKVAVAYNLDSRQDGLGQYDNSTHSVFMLAVTSLLPVTLRMPSSVSASSAHHAATSSSPQDAQQ